MEATKNKQGWNLRKYDYAFKLEVWTCRILNPTLTKYKIAKYFKEKYGVSHVTIYRILKGVSR